MAHLRQWRWFIVSLIFFYGLGLFVSPARATSIGVALRVFDSSNGWRILGRSQRSTEDFERLLKTDVGFLCILHGAPEMVEQKFFVGIHKNGTLEVTKGAKHELKVQVARNVSQKEEEEEKTEKPQYTIILSDKTRRWFLCLNGSTITSMEIALDEDLPNECAWIGSQDSVCIRIRPLLQPQQSIQLGEYTTSFRDAILCLQISAEVESSQRNVCLEVRASLKSVAKKDLSLAYRLLRSLRTARRKLKLALLKQGVESKAARATIQIINRLVQVRHDIKMTQWDYEGITAVDQKGFIGVSGCRCEVPKSVEEEIDAYIAFKAKQQTLVWEEQKLVRSLFDRTKKLSSWSNASLLAYKQHPSLSRILQGLNFLPRNMTDLETSLHLVPRYLTEEYTSEISKRSSNSLERAVLLKLEEIVVRRRPKDLYFLNKSECVKDLLNRLPGKSQSSNVSVSDVCKSGTLRHPSLLSFAHSEVEVDHKMGLSE